MIRIRYNTRKRLYYSISKPKHKLNRKFPRIPLDIRDSKFNRHRLGINNQRKRVGRGFEGDPRSRVLTRRGWSPSPMQCASRSDLGILVHQVTLQVRYMRRKHTSRSIVSKTSVADTQLERSAAVECVCGRL